MKQRRKYLPHELRDNPQITMEHLYLAKIVGAEAWESCKTFFIKPDGKTKEPPTRMMALDMKTEMTSPLEK